MFDKNITELMKNTGCPNGRLPVLPSNEGRQQFTTGHGKAFGFVNKVNEIRSIRTVLALGFHSGWCFFDCGR